MDNQAKSVSWIGNICEKFETFCSEIDGVIKKDLQYAESQLLTAGANVKQLCSEFMEEMLSESVSNSLREKTSLSENDKSVDHACGISDKEAGAGQTNGLSDCDSSTPPISIETVEETHTTEFTLKANDGKEMSFEENRVKGRKCPSDILKFEGHGNGDFHGLHNLPKPLQVDLQSSYSPEAGETSDLYTGDGEAKLSTAQDLAASIVFTGSNEYQLPENEVSSSDRTLLKELIDDGLNDRKAGETKDKYITIVGIMQLANRVKIEDSCVMVDSDEHHLTSDCPDEHPVYQRTVCKSCLTMKFEKECECEKTAGSKDCNAESGQPEGRFLSQPFLTGDSESVDQEFCESDWVIV